MALRRLGVVLVVVAVASVAFCTTWTSPAGAYVEPPVAGQPYNTATTGDLMTALRTARGTTNMAPFEAAFAGGDGLAAQKGVTRAAMAARVLPASTAVGAITLGPVAFAVGWKVGTTIYQQFLAPAAQTAAGQITGYQLNVHTSPSAACPSVPCHNILVLASGCAAHPSVEFIPPVGTPDWSDVTCTDEVGEAARDKLDALVASTGIAKYTTTRTMNSEYSNGSGTFTQSLPETTDQFAQASGLRAMTQADYDALPAGPGKVATAAYTEPAHDSADAAAARAILDAGDHHSRDLVNWIIDPSYPGETEGDFILPQPEPDETYGAYAARLRDRGWLGTLTVEPASALEAGADPASAYATAPLHAPAGVQVSTATMIWVYDLTAPTPGDRPDPEWPDNPPSVPTHSDITIKEKPGDSVLPPTGGGGGGDLDFTPITDLDPGCKFPYGLFCYASDVTGWFSVTADAPVFDFTLDCPGLADCDTYEFGPVDLDVMDDYMEIWRTLLSIALWVGAVWMLASRLLGLNLGDPGEAVDDPMEF